MVDVPRAGDLPVTVPGCFVKQRPIEVLDLVSTIQSGRPNDSDHQTPDLGQFILILGATLTFYVTYVPA